MNRLKHSAVVVYNRLAASTVGRVFLAILLAMMGFIAGATFLLGVAAGAGHPTAELPQIVNEVTQVEATVWAEMGEASALVRSLWGLFHWLLAFSVWLGIQGVYIGAAIPPWMYTPTELAMEVFPWIVVIYIAVQIVRLVEIVAGRDYIYNTGGGD